MRTLVTGGAGFIGSTLVDRLLAEGHVVDVVDDLSSGSLANLGEARRHRAAFSFTQLDVRDPALPELFAQRRPEVVFHLAAQSSVAQSVERPLADAEVNILGSLRVLEAARAAAVAEVVFAASAGALYEEPEGSGRAVPRARRSIHARPTGWRSGRSSTTSRATASSTASSTAPLPSRTSTGPARTTPARVASSRSSSPNCSPPSPARSSVTAARPRDFVYVDDVVDAFSRPRSGAPGLILNIGTGVETSVTALVRTALRPPRHEVEGPSRPARPGEVRRARSTSAGPAVHLGWRPWTALEEGLRSTLEARAGADEGRGLSRSSAGGVGAARLLGGVVAAW